MSIEVLLLSNARIYHGFECCGLLAIAIHWNWAIYLKLKVLTRAVKIISDHLISLADP
jgi:hypothetical protein